MRENRKEEGEEECTFKPRLVTQERPVQRREKASTSRQRLEGANKHSIDKYVQRMSSARKEKENVEKRMQEGVGSGRHWKNQITVPKPPLMSSMRKKEAGGSTTHSSSCAEIRSLKKPVAPVVTEKMKREQDSMLRGWGANDDCRTAEEEELQGIRIGENMHF